MPANKRKSGRIMADHPPTTSAPVPVIRAHPLLRLKRVVRLGVKSLWLHRLRSLLTVLGIVFGVCSVIVMLPARIMREYVWNISRRVDSEIVATVPWYPAMRNHRVAQGRFFTEAEMESKANVCVLGVEMVGAIFPLDS